MTVLSLPPMSFGALIRHILEAFSCKLVPERGKKRQKRLSDLLAELKAAEVKQNPSPSSKSSFSVIQEKLRTFYLQDYNNSLSRFKWNFYSQGDKPGRFLANRVKFLQAKSKIQFITTASGSRLYDPRSITNSFAEYYSNLYNIQDDPSIPPVTPAAVQTFLSKLSLPSLNPSQLEFLNSPISVSECACTIRAILESTETKSRRMRTETAASRSATVMRRDHDCPKTARRARPIYGLARIFRINNPYHGLSRLF